MDDNEQRLAEEAKQYARSKDFKELLIKKFADPNIYKPVKVPATFLMAGSPGAGKTEFSKQFIQKFEEMFHDRIIRIDADDIREFFPQYNKKNSEVVQGAAAIGVEKLYDSVLKHQQYVVIDGTFANYDKSASNIERSLRRGRDVFIVYVFQEPVIAWDFTKKREEIEGRNIPREAFIKSFLLARENVNRAKLTFKNQVILSIVIKDYVNDNKDFKLDIQNIDEHLEKVYTEDELNEIVK